MHTEEQMNQQGFYSDNPYTNQILIRSSKLGTIELDKFPKQHLVSAYLIRGEKITIQYLSKNKKYFIAKYHRKISYGNIKYVIVPLDLIYSGYFKFENQQLTNNIKKDHLDDLIAQIDNPQEIDANFINKIISGDSGHDVFLTKTENRMVQTSALEKYGILKFSINLEEKNYKANKRRWSIWSERALSSKTIHEENLIGTNMYGAIREYKKLNVDYRTILLADYFVLRFPQSPQNARKAKSIIAYGKLYSAGIESYYNNATIEEPTEIYGEKHNLSLNVFLIKIIMEDGQNEYTIPIKDKNEKF